MESKVFEELSEATYRAKKLLDNVRSIGSKHNGAKVRKESRKAGRIEKKNRTSRGAVSRTKAQSRIGPTKVISDDAQNRPWAVALKPQDRKDFVVSEKAFKKFKVNRHNQTPGDETYNGINSSNPPSPPPSNSNLPGIRNNFAADDAEIAALENALGVKRGKKSSNSFEEDGLDILLNGIESGGEAERLRLGKRKRSDEDRWLKMKRRKASKMASQDSDPEFDSIAKSDESLSNFAVLSDVEDLMDENTVADKESGSDIATGQRADLAHEPGFHRKKVRENPYKAPETATVAVAKYIPPSLRNQSSSETEDQSRLKRQIQGLLNRLSEANMITILTETEALYRNHPRQHVSTILLELLLGLVSDPASLQDTFLILHAGFMTSLYKIIGPDFGAQLIQKVDEHFVFESGLEIRNGKTLVNLVSLLSDLYAFQIIGSGIIYDYIRSLIAEDFSEATAELLLKILRSKSSLTILAACSTNLDNRLGSTVEAGRSFSIEGNRRSGP